MAVSQRDLNLAVIGNSGFGALIDRRGTVVWSCFPRFDGDPVFCDLLKSTRELGFWSISVEKEQRIKQAYITNTACLSTTVWDSNGGCVEITDFVPLFRQYDRTYRPTMIVRIVKPVAGRPRVRIRLRPTFAYGWGTPEKSRGSNHIRYLLPTMTLRLTTNAPVAYLLEEVLFEVEEPIFLVLMPDESLTNSLAEFSTSYLEKTKNYWYDWVRTLSIPFEWQEEVIRSCITLKLHSVDETGAIIAAPTTSIPTSPGKRGYDYRHCWLRDSYFVIHMLNQLGSTDVMERYLLYISNIVADFNETGNIQPVYGMGLEKRLPVREMHRLPGFRSMATVTIGNNDHKMIQNDVFGAVILSLTQLFFDSRLGMKGDKVLFDRLEGLGKRALEVYCQKDSGPRGAEEETLCVHTFSVLMCWAACDRLAKISNRLKLDARKAFWEESAETIRQYLMENCWNEEKNSFVDRCDGDDVDCHLLLLADLGFVKPKDPKFLGTLAYCENRLRKGDYMLSTPEKDDQSNPSCVASFWFINALAQVGRTEEARTLFSRMISGTNSFGLLSESIDASGYDLWGNFPHTTSTVGLISSAMRLSVPWSAAF